MKAKLNILNNGILQDFTIEQELSLEKICSRIILMSIHSYINKSQLKNLSHVIFYSCFIDV